MNDLSKFLGLEGNWSGEYNLFLYPNPDPEKSASIMEIRSLLFNNFVQLAYTWQNSEKDQAGVLIIGYNAQRKLVLANWIDSWHMDTGFMLCEGYLEESHNITFKGNYRVSEGPDWGWRTEIKIENEKEFELRMYNVTPQGPEALAVQVNYSRNEP